MANRNVLIRADASPSIGMGHRVRCQILADAFSEKDWLVRFVAHTSCQLFDDQSDIVINDESEFLALAEKADLVILDHYGYDSSMIEALYQQQSHLLLLDDMNDRGALTFRWLLNPISLDYRDSIQHIRKKYDSSACLFTGIQYALLRYQFKKTLPCAVRKKLLISMGGTDPLALTLPILKALNKFGFPQNDLIVMLGKNAQKAQAVKLFCQLNDIECQQDVIDVARLMSRAKMAISAGGSTLFELAAMKVPSTFFQVAENQTELLKEHGDKGWCRVYKLHNKNETKCTIDQACRQLLLDWRDIEFLTNAKKKIPTAKNASLINLIINDLQKSV